MLRVHPASAGHGLNLQDGGREHAQAECRAIKSFYGGKRANAPWWCGFERRAWDDKAVVDWLGPVAVAALAMAV